MASRSGLTEYERQRDLRAGLQGQLNVAESQNPSTEAKAGRASLLFAVTLVFLGLVFAVKALNFLQDNNNNSKLFPRNVYRPLPKSFRREW